MKLTAVTHHALTLPGSKEYFIEVRGGITREEMEEVYDKATKAELDLLNLLGNITTPLGLPGTLRLLAEIVVIQQRLDKDKSTC